MSIQISGPVVPPDGTVTAPKINSGSSTVGFVLTADGVGGADFDELPAAGGALLATGAIIGATGQRQIFTTGVGVGASPPTAMLGVRGADSLNTSFASNISGATGTGLVVTNAGNVGIGTSTPSYANLAIGQATPHSGNSAGLAIGRPSSIPSGPTNYGNIYLFSTDDMAVDKGGAISFGADYETGDANRDTRMSAIFGGKEDGTSGEYNGYLSFYTRSTGGSPTEKVRITSIGNVGIGTTSPTAALHLPASSTARASLRIPAGTAPTAPNAGDVWVDGTVIKFYDGTTTKEIAFV